MLESPRESHSETPDRLDDLAGGAAPRLRFRNDVPVRAVAGCGIARSRARSNGRRCGRDECVCTRRAHRTGRAFRSCPFEASSLRQVHRLRDMRLLRRHGAIVPCRGACIRSALHHRSFRPADSAVRRSCAPRATSSRLTARGAERPCPGTDLLANALARCWFGACSPPIRN